RLALVGPPRPCTVEDGRGVDRPHVRGGGRLVPLARATGHRPDAPLRGPGAQRRSGAHARHRRRSGPRGRRVSGRLLAPEPAGPLVRRERPTLSVVIPYYRRADVIAEAVRSALHQTLPPYEVVICDDGSPDDLDGALGPMRDRVTVVRRRNGGAAAALNTAASVATGEYVVQLDSDDVFLPRRLEAISDAVVVRPDLDVVATDALIEEDGEVLWRFRDAVPFAVDDQRRAVLRHCFFAWPAMRRSRLLA